MKENYEFVIELVLQLRRVSVYSPIEKLEELRLFQLVCQTRIGRRSLVFVKPVDQIFRR